MDEPTQRLDLWLWYARFYRSRSDATEAVKAGHVKVNQQRVKPARSVHPGDALSVQRGQDIIDVMVRGLPRRRGPAPEAAQFYEETADSMSRRALARQQAAGTPSFAPPTPGRPDKRTRRLLRDGRHRSVFDHE
jgi:ribosome-associated heat shock protein Hsp15